MGKNILIIKACGVDGEKEECENVKSQAKLYEIDVVDFCPKTTDELYEDLRSHGKAYDYIYLSSHGDADGFGNESGSIDLTWVNFGSLLCASMVMKEDCVVFLSCCRGGLNQVAYDLIYCCGKISYIVGPRQSLYPSDMLIGFNILLYNLEHRGVDPIVACEKIKLGTDIRFVCFDALETETEAGFLMHIRKYAKEEYETITKAKIIADEEPVAIPKEIRVLLKPKE